MKTKLLPLLSFHVCYKCFRSRHTEECGYDGGKKVKGRKRHIVVDILGCLLLVQVHAANIHDTKAAGELMFRAADSYPSLKAFSANAGYRGTAVTYAPEQLGGTLYISEKIKGEFAVLPNPWGLERTFASWASVDR